MPKVAFLPRDGGHGHDHRMHHRYTDYVAIVRQTHVLAARRGGDEERRRFWSRYSCLLSVLDCSIRILMPCVDAPTDASEIFSVMSMWSSAVVCPASKCGFTRRRPLWKCEDQVHHAYARSRRFGTDWFSRSRSFDRLPISLLRLATSADSPAAASLSGAGWNLVYSAMRKQRPCDPRHFIC
jgi:hypothetical protein